MTEIVWNTQVQGPAPPEELGLQVERKLDMSQQ